MARPATSQWKAMLIYWEFDENGKKINQKQLKKDGSQYFENEKAAVSALEELQIDGKVGHEIWVRLYDQEFVIEPVEQSVITYKRTAVEEVPEKNDPEETEIPEELSEEKEETKDDIPGLGDEEPSNEIPDVD